MQSTVLLMVALSAIDMTILVPIVFDLSVQMHADATISGLLLGAHLASQPLGGLLGRFATSQSYDFQRRFVVVGFCVHAMMTWAVVPILGMSHVSLKFPFFEELR